MRGAQNVVFSRKEATYPTMFCRMSKVLINFAKIFLPNYSFIPLSLVI